MRVTLSESTFGEGYVDSLPILDPRAENSFARGSRNLIPDGISGNRPWAGLLSKGIGTGARKMAQIGSKWGGLADIGTLEGAGSIFADIGNSLWLCGAGQAQIEGTPLLGITASTLLSVAIAINGNYDAAHFFQAGLPQSSAADISVLSSPGAGFAGITNGPISIKIARLRLTTGARSIASLTSAVIVPAKQSFRVTFPLPASGQDNWAVFGTQEGFGGIGLHYRLKYGIGTAAVLDVPESVVAAGIVDGIPRSLEFDYVTGDLIPELAYIDDYPPPAGTHAVRLENVMVVLGAFADSVSGPTSTDTGTVGACSLPNFYESYKPDHRVYFPEQIVDHRARQTDSYAYVAHKNSITALQYVGLRDGPAVALTMILPDVGIEKPHNWCQVGGLLYMRVADGAFIRMRADGSIDYAWAAKIWNAVKDWDENTVISWHPNSMSVVISNGGDAYAFDLLTENWSTRCYFMDAGVSGTALSAINSRGEMIMTITNGGVQTAYSWDEGATEMPIGSVTPWTRYRPRLISEGTIRSVNVRELGITYENDRSDVPLFVAIHRNVRRPVAVHDAATTNGSSRIDSATANFDAANVTNGDMVLIFGEDVGGPGIDYLLGRIAGLGDVSASPSPSASPSRSPSASASRSPSASTSPSGSASASPSRSPSHSQSLSPSSSFSNSPSLSPSASVSPSASPSVSPSSSVSLSPSASPSRSPSSSPSASPSRSPSSSPSAS